MQYFSSISKITTISVCFQGKPFNITEIQVYAPVTNAKEAEVEWFYEDLQNLLELTPKKKIFFLSWGQECKIESQEIPGVTGKFDLGLQNEAGQRLTEFFQETKKLWSQQVSSSNNTRDGSTHRYHQMVNNDIRSIIFFVAEDEKLYTVSKNKAGS